MTSVRKYGDSVLKEKTFTCLDGALREDKCAKETKTSDSVTERKSE